LKKSNQIQFEQNLNHVLEKLKGIPFGKEYDEVSIPLYLHQNFFVRNLFLNRFKTAHKLTNFNNKVVLDYGCGSGAFLESISFEISKGIGIDLDISVAKKIISSSNVGIYEIDHLKEVENATIDILTSFDVLEHVEKLESLLKHFANILTTNGEMIISGPTENTIYKIARKFAQISIKGNLKGGEEHVRNITDIKEKILQSGFVLEKNVNLMNLFHVMKFKKT